MGDNVKKKGNRLLVVLVSVMSVVTLSVLGVLGVVLYKGYASESDSVNVNTNFSHIVVDDESYYDKVKEYLDAYVSYAEKVYPVILKGNMTDADKEVSLKYTNEFILYSQEFSASPVTYEDDLLDDNFFDFKMSAQNFADYAKSYLYKDEKVYINFMKNSFKDTQIHVDTIAEIENKYYK